MLHLSHSQNILDLKAADPYITNTRESLPARLGYSVPMIERSNTTSIMKKDYGPLTRRRYVDVFVTCVKTVESLKTGSGLYKRTL